MLFGEEAVTPEEIRWGSLRTESKEEGDEAATKDAIEEARMEVVQNLKKYQEEIKRWRNKTIIGPSLREGDLVLRLKQGHVNKLQEKWEGPYVLSKVYDNRACSLRALDGENVPLTWNEKDLRKYYL